jgi:hypothetical protein
MNLATILALISLLSTSSLRREPQPPVARPSGVPSPQSVADTRMISTVQVRVLAPDGSPVEDVAVALVGLTAPLVGGVTDAAGLALLQSPVGFPINEGAVRLGFAAGPSMPTGKEYGRLLARTERLTNDYAVPRWTPLVASPSNVAAAADATAVIQLKSSVSARARIVLAPGALWAPHIFGTMRPAYELDEKAATATLRGVPRGETTTIFVGVGAQVTPVHLTAEQTQQDVVELGEFRESSTAAKASLRIELNNASPLRLNKRRSFIDGLTLVARDGKAIYTYYGRVDPATQVLSVEAISDPAKPAASRVPPPGDYFVAPGWFIGPFEDQMELLTLVWSGRAEKFADIPVITIRDEVENRVTIDLLAAREAIMAASAK